MRLHLYKFFIVLIHTLKKVIYLPLIEMSRSEWENNTQYSIKILSYNVSYSH